MRKLKFLFISYLFLYCFSPQGYSQSDKGLYAWWTFDEEKQGVALDQAGNSEAEIMGPHEYVPGVKGKALKLDGFRTYIQHKYSDPQIKGAFSIEAWVALASYPWNWSPVVDNSRDQITGYFLGIGSEGNIGLHIAAGNSWTEINSVSTIPLRKWVHLAAVFLPGEGVSIYINGKLDRFEKIQGFMVASTRNIITLGRGVTTQDWKEFQLETDDTYFFLDGILDEVKIHNTALTADEVSKSFRQVSEFPEPALTNRNKLPSGPEGKGSFGAYYTKLDYYKEWDDMWRVSDVPDVLVRFDESPARLVFWRGTSFVPCWVTENDIWYSNEWLETWGSDVQSCAEPIMDRHCKFSHVRIIENTDARVVVHWRYALVDAFYTPVAVDDDGRGEWCDEFHIIYPDQMGIRKMELHYSKPERKHDWVEQMLILPPGRYPGESIEKDEVTLVNMNGDVKNYSIADEFPFEMKEPEGANISIVNTKSDYKPFLIIPPDPVETVEGSWPSPFFRTYYAKLARGGYRPDPVPTIYGWWDHWPVAQIPGDGRWVLYPDRPSHFSMTTFVQWKDLEVTDRTRTRIMLTGVSEKDANGLVEVAKSWLQAPQAKVVSSNLTSLGFNQAERAFIFRKKDADPIVQLDIKLNASKESPLLNPAFIITNWGKTRVEVEVDGKMVPEGENFRQGIRTNLEGTDLIIWLRIEADHPVELTIKPVK